MYLPYCDPDELLVDFDDVRENSRDDRIDFVELRDSRLRSILEILLLFMSFFHFWILTSAYERKMHKKPCYKPFNPLFCQKTSKMEKK